MVVCLVGVLCLRAFVCLFVCVRCVWVGWCVVGVVLVGGWAAGGEGGCGVAEEVGAVRVGAMVRVGLEWGGEALYPLCSCG